MNEEALRTFEAARATVAANLKAGTLAIDGEFGRGYAKANPALLAAYLQACGLADISVGLSEVGALVRDGLVSG